MNDPEQILTRLKEEFEHWENVLGSLSEAQATTSQLPNGWSVKDLTAHLMAWQQVSVARLEAARKGEEPVWPEWLAGTSPEEAEEDVDRFNARIDATYRGQPWPWVHRQWRDGFVTLLTLAEAIPEGDFADTKKYLWLKGYSLLDDLKGSYEHHHEDHLQPLLAWVDRRENASK